MEEQFYLLWPAVLALVGIARGARAAVALACAAVVWRLLDMHFHWVAHIQPLLQGDMHRTDYCIGQLFWGCAMAFAWRSPRVRPALAKFARSDWALGLIGAQILLLIAKPVGYLALVEILMAFLPIATVADPQGWLSRLLETKPIVWMGHLSYSLYLWQQLFLQSAIPQRILGPIPGLLGNLALPFFPAVFSYYFVERPFIGMGRRLERKWQLGQATPPPGSARQTDSKAAREIGLG